MIVRIAIATSCRSAESITALTAYKLVDNTQKPGRVNAIVAVDRSNCNKNQKSSCGLRGTLLDVRKLSLKIHTRNFLAKNLSTNVTTYYLLNCGLITNRNVRVSRTSRTCNLNGLVPVNKGSADRIRTTQ